MRQSPATPRGGAGDEVDATVHNTVAEALSRSSEEGAGIHGAPVTGATVPEAGEISSATAEAIEAVVAALEPSPEDAPVSHFLREYGIAMASVGDPDSREGSERATTTSTTSAACSDLMVSDTHTTLPPPRTPPAWWLLWRQFHSAYSDTVWCFFIQIPHERVRVSVFLGSCWGGAVN